MRHSILGSSCFCLKNKMAEMENISLNIGEDLVNFANSGPVSEFEEDKDITMKLKFFMNLFVYH